MPVKSYKPITPGQRGKTTLRYDHLTTDHPHKPLTEIRKRHGGRDNLGRISVRHKGGGHKRLYRIIDFRRDKRKIAAKVLSVEYDPNRSANIALVCYADGEKRYILHAQGLQVGQSVVADPEADILTGNALPLRNMPLGTVVHNIEMRPGKGGQLCRGAGTSAQLLAKENGYAQLRMPSGEVREVLLECYATVGQVGNLDWENVSIGKAGRTRWRGIRPTVRGVAMNPVDHPLGGGEGKTSGGRNPVTPWGQPTRGYKTRRVKRTNTFIIKRRK